MSYYEKILLASFLAIGVIEVLKLKLLDEFAKSQLLVDMMATE